MVPVFIFGEINALHKWDFKSIPNIFRFFREIEEVMGSNLCIWYGRVIVPERVPINMIGINFSLLFVC